MEALAAEPALSALAVSQPERPVWVQTDAVDVFANHPAVNRVFNEEISYPESAEHKSLSFLVAQSRSFIQSIVDAADTLRVALNRVAPRLYLSAAEIVNAKRLRGRLRADKGGSKAQIVVVSDVTNTWEDVCAEFWQSLVAALAKRASCEIVSHGRSFSFAGYGGQLPAMPCGVAAVVSNSDIWLTDSPVVALAAAASGVAGILVSGNPFLDEVFPAVLRIEQPEDPVILVKHIDYIIAQNTKLLSKS